MSVPTGLSADQMRTVADDYEPVWSYMRLRWMPGDVYACAVVRLRELNEQLLRTEIHRILKESPRG